MTDIIEFLPLAPAAFYAAMALLFFIGLRRIPSGSSDRRYFVSVVVAARDEEDRIRPCLESLVDQSYPRDRFEIVVVDDHSSDRTAAIIKEFARRYPNIRLLHAAHARTTYTPKKRALDFGIRNSTGKIVLTTDADCQAEHRWIEAMVSHFADDVGVVVGFSQLGRRTDNLSAFGRLQAIDFLSLMSAAAGAVNVGLPLASSGQNLGYRRQAYVEVGGFERIGHRLSGDDVLLLQLIHKKTSWRTVFSFDPGSFNTTWPMERFRGYVNQRKRWASNGPFLVRINKFFFAYMLSVFLMHVALLVGPPLALFTNWVSLPAVLGAAGAKVLLDFLVLIRGAVVFRRTDLLKLFPLWELVQIPGILVSGILGAVGTVTWKRRQEPARARYLAHPQLVARQFSEDGQPPLGR